MPEPVTVCKICGDKSPAFAQATVLHRHAVQYYRSKLVAYRITVPHYSLCLSL